MFGFIQCSVDKSGTGMIPVLTVFENDVQHVTGWSDLIDTVFIVRLETNPDDRY